MNRSNVLRLNTHTGSFNLIQRVRVEATAGEKNPRHGQWTNRLDSI